MNSLLRQLKLEKLRRLQSQAPKINLRELLFTNQIEAISDKNPFVSLCTTRRAGKSTAKGAKALEVAEQYPGSEIPYIALTRDSTERIIWKVLKEFIEQYKLPYRAIDSELKIKTNKGSTIFLIGADQKNFIERFRGAKFPVAFIDEAGAFRDAVLQSLVQDILEPCVSDYQGQIFMSGTPGPVPKGFFYEASKLKQHGFTSHFWSVVDNPHLPHITNEWLDEMLKRKGQTRENPTFRREWLGEWVEDPDALVYKYQRGRNDYSGDVPQGARRVLGIDYGWNDKTAFAIVSYHPHHNKIWVEHVEGHQGMIPTEIAGRIQQIMAKYKPTSIVADTGGLGRSITEEMRRRYGIPIQAAEKTDKMSWISLMNGDFIDGNLLVHDSCTEYKDQLLILAKDDDGDEDPTLPNDLCDAVLYSTRFVYAYASRPLVPKITDPIEKFKESEKKWLEQEERQTKKEWWENVD